MKIFHLYRQQHPILKHLHRYNASHIFCTNMFGVDADTVSWSPALIEHINEGADVLMLSGDILGSFFNERQSVVDRLEVPIVVCGATFGDQKISQELMELKNKAEIFSVGTMTDGIELGDPEVVPPLLVFASRHRQPYTHKCFDNGDFKLGMDLAAGELCANSSLLKGAVAFAERNDTLTYWMCVPDDFNSTVRQDIELFNFGFGKRGIRLMKEDYPNLFRNRYLSSLLWPEVYDKMDLVITDSIAGACLCTSMGTPFVGIGQAAKISQQIGLGEYIHSDITASRVFDTLSNTAAELERVTDHLVMTTSQFDFVIENFVNRVKKIKP